MKVIFLIELLVNYIKRGLGLQTPNLPDRGTPKLGLVRFNIATSLIIILLIVNCSNKKDKNYYELYKERVLLEILTAPAPNPLNACIESYKTMETCLKQTTKAQEFPGGLNEMSLTSVLSNNLYFRYEDQCRASLSSESQSKFSESAKECIQNCQKKYWDTRIKENKCTEDFTSQLQGINTGTTSCIRTCFQLTNIEVKF